MKVNFDLKPEFQQFQDEATEILRKVFLGDTSETFNFYHKHCSRLNIPLVVEDDNLEKTPTGFKVGSTIAYYNPLLKYMGVSLGLICGGGELLSRAFILEEMVHAVTKRHGLFRKHEFNQAVRKEYETPNELRETLASAFREEFGNFVGKSEALKDSLKGYIQAESHHDWRDRLINRLAGHNTLAEEYIVDMVHSKEYISRHPNEFGWRSVDEIMLEAFPQAYPVLQQFEDFLSRQTSGKPSNFWSEQRYTGR